MNRQYLLGAILLVIVSILFWQSCGHFRKQEKQIQNYEKSIKSLQKSIDSFKTKNDSLSLHIENLTHQDSLNTISRNNLENSLSSLKTKANNSYNTINSYNKNQIDSSFSNIYGKDKSIDTVALSVNIAKKALNDVIQSRTLKVISQTQDSLITNLKYSNDIKDSTISLMNRKESNYKSQISIYEKKDSLYESIKDQYKIETNNYKKKLRISQSKTWLVGALMVAYIIIRK